jgi:hypothetical protein
MYLYDLAISFRSSLKDSCSVEARRQWWSALPGDAGVAHGRCGAVDAGGVWCGRGADAASYCAGTQPDARAHQHSHCHRYLYRDGNSYSEAEAQTYLDDSAAPAAAWATKYPNSPTFTHQYARHRRNSYDYHHSWRLAYAYLHAFLPNLQRHGRVDGAGEVSARGVGWHAVLVRPALNHPSRAAA